MVTIAVGDTVGQSITVIGVQSIGPYIELRLSGLVDTLPGDLQARGLVCTRYGWSVYQGYYAHCAGDIADSDESAK